MGNRMHKAPVWMLENSAQVAKCILPDGKRFVFLMRGHSPQIVPIAEQGEYEVDAALLPGSDTSFPMVVTVIDLAHIKAWQNMPAHAVDGMLDACIRAALPEAR